ncbi:MAG: T9SS type A sorting domain-containing protein [Bacteroidetes bacterium]|nr:T9SS type A sorting domain-containing protein [Bacteroidota bacterium]
MKCFCFGYVQISFARILLFSLILCCTYSTSFSQKQGNIWYFGARQGLDFNSGTPVVLKDGMTGMVNGVQGLTHGNSVVSDGNGKLLFYTDNMNIYNAKHRVMPNGDSIGLYGLVQYGSAIVPLPGSNHIFYLFVGGSSIPSMSGLGRTDYEYTVVDMCLDSNRGDVVPGKKQISMTDSSCDVICVCEDANKTGYWILGAKRNTDQLWSWHLTESGLSSPVISRIRRPFFGGAALGYVSMRFSPDSKKLAITKFDSSYITFGTYDFDAASGTVSNECLVQLDSAGLLAAIMCAEFSPDASKLYVTIEGVVDGQNNPLFPKRLLQYDLTVNNCAAFKASQKTLYSVLTADSVYFGSMSAGPDGKIYIGTGSNWVRIGRINYPNLAGAAAQFDTAFLVAPTNKFSVFTFPHFIAGFKYHNGAPACPGPAGIPELNHELFRVFPNPAQQTIQLQSSVSNVASRFQILITNVLGKKIAQSQWKGKSHTIEVKDWPDGIYYYQLLKDDQVYQTGHFLKN